MGLEHDYIQKGFRQSPILILYPSIEQIDTPNKFGSTLAN